jgi:hypothetical protein
MSADFFIGLGIGFVLAVILFDQLKRLGNPTRDKIEGLEMDYSPRSKGSANDA